MFKAFCEDPSIRNVAKTCEHAEATARKYRKIDNWDKRRVEIQAQVQAETGQDAKEMISRQVRACREIQDIGLRAIRKKRFRSRRENTSTAVDAVLAAGKREAVLLGEPGERVEVIDQIQERYARHKQAAGR